MARIFLNIILCTMLCSFCLARGFTEENLCDSLRFLLWDRSTSFLYDLLNCNSMLSTCGTSASRHRDNCGPYPWVVSLRKRSTREHECVGTFVDNRNIITAASCFKNRKSFKDIEVGYGSQHTGYLDYSDIRSVTFHPKYNPKTSMNDIAIVTIQRKVDNRKSPCVQPICLPGKIGYSSSGDTVTIAGWGYSSKFLPQQFCPTLCMFIRGHRCPTTSSFCRLINSQCGCGSSVIPTTTTRRTTTSTTTRRPIVTSGCGVGAMGNPANWIETLPRIVGGMDAFEGYFPWQVKLRPGGAHCGGTLVDSDTVVTAAHCVVSFENNPGSVQVQYGSINLNSAMSQRASRVIIHPNYKTQSVPDLAIIKLPNRISFNNLVRPACLPSQNQAIVAKTRAIVSGWGVLSESGSRLPNIMQYVSVPIVDQDSCNDSYRGGIRAGEVCAGYSQGGRDACQGDSGGALVQPSPRGDRFQLIGVVSRGLGCARPNLPGIYTRVPNYVDWIRRYL